MVGIFLGLKKPLMLWSTRYSYLSYRTTVLHHQHYITVDWVHSYLSDRFQIIDKHGSFSQPQLVDMLVIQGSLLALPFS